MSSHPRDPNLQDSFGPEIATSDAPQTIVESGLPEAVAPGLYAQQAEKHNNHANYSNHEISTTPVGGYRKRKVLGLPFLCFWGLAGALILLIGLGVGLGVGLGLNSRAASSTSSAATTTTSSAVGDSATTAATSSSLAGTTTAASSTTATTTTAAATATATGASVAICQNAYLDYCTTIDVPASSCINFQSSYNDSVSSVDTGGPVCLFYTDPTCAGDFWRTNGTQDLIPGEFNDAFSSVSCE